MFWGSGGPWQGSRGRGVRQEALLDAIEPRVAPGAGLDQPRRSVCLSVCPPAPFVREACVRTTCDESLGPFGGKRGAAEKTKRSSKQRHRCACPPATTESPRGSASSPAAAAVVFWILAVQTGVRWYLVVVVLLICISLVTHDVDHLFTCIFSISVSFLVSCLLRSLTPFLTQLFVLSFKSSVDTLDQGFPTPGPWTGTCPWPVRNQVA